MQQQNIGFNKSVFCFFTNFGYFCDKNSVLMTHLLLMTTSAVLLWLIGGAYVALIVAMVVSVLSENRNPVRSIAWVTALVLFPVGGAVLYYFFGRSLRNVKMISRRNRRRLLSESPKPLAKTKGDLSPDARRCMKLLYSVADSQVYSSNNVQIFTDGKDHFESLFEDLRNARHFINIQFYIIANDELGHKLRDILLERAAAGVRIRVIYDYIGSFDARRRDFFMRMKGAGIEVHSFFRVRFPEKLNRLNWRNHRKVVVVDGAIGYIGGMNVADRYIDGGRFKGWRDTAVRVTGSAVAGLQYNFAVDWKFMGHELLVDEQAHPAASTPIVSEANDTIRDVTVQLVTSGPIDRWGNASMLFMRAISQAKKRVYIQTPYFLPSDGLITALQCASLSGVDVRIMIPRESDSSLLTHASFSYVEECLLAGIKIMLYNGGMLHAKTLLVDDDFATIGSVNFDFRSFEHNFEENIVMYSKDVNSFLANRFAEDSELCTRPRITEWAKRPRPMKIKQALARLLSPIL